MTTRRSLLTLLGSAAAAWPMAGRAQQTGMPVIGYLGFETLDVSQLRLNAFKRGLAETGFEEGRNVKIEFRMANYQTERLPALAAELVQQRVALIAALGGVRSALAAKAATTSIPIIFNTGGDPVKLGLVASLNRPNGNITGTTALGNTIVSKELQQLHELFPTANMVGFLVNPDNPNTEIDVAEMKASSEIIGIQVVQVSARLERDFDSAFASLVQRGVRCAIVQLDGIFNTRLAQVAAMSARHSIAAIHSQREFPLAGGLMSYGANVGETFRELGIYAGRILKGETPADLPVVQATKFEMVINLQTARALGLTFPPTLLALADEVIE